ncbi:hypothetical protein [Nostoc sp.]
MVIGHWSLVIGHWSLVIGHWSFVSITYFDFPTAIQENHDGFRRGGIG